MLKYVGKRLFMIIPTLVFIIFLIFLILSFIPSSPGRIILGMNAKEEQVVALNESLGWYDPMPVKFVNYLKGVLQGLRHQHLPVRNRPAAGFRWAPVTSVTQPN